MARKTTPSYADITRIFALAEKIHKNFGSDAGETNKPDDLIILSALLKLKKRLDDLSQKTRSGKIISKAIKRYNRKAPAGKAFTEAEIADKREDSCERDYNEACSIFNEAVDTGIGLPSVPAVDGTSWSFMILQNWCNESLRKISKTAEVCIQNILKHKAGETSGGKTGSRSIDSQNKHEDIVELKPNFCGIGLNINALIRKRKWGIKIKNSLKAFIYRILRPK